MSQSTLLCSPRAACRTACGFGLPTLCRKGSASFDLCAPVGDAARQQRSAAKRHARTHAPSFGSTGGVEGFGEAVKYREHVSCLGGRRAFAKVLQGWGGDEAADRAHTTEPLTYLRQIRAALHGGLAHSLQLLHGRPAGCNKLCQHARKLTGSQPHCNA